MLVSDIPALRQYWYPVARAADVDARPVPARLLGQDLVLWRAEPAAPVLAADH